MRDVLARKIQVIGLIICAGFMAFSCTQREMPDYSDVASCVGCHTNYTHLKLVHSPDTTEAVGGCGGGAPEIAPYDRVYLDEDGYNSYKRGYHNIGCTTCHGGINGTFEKDLAHSGDNFLRHPSDDYQNKCGNCHGEIAANFVQSLHNGTGQKRKVAMRMGYSGPEDFDQLPAHQIEGYNANCATCHGTCGNCHVNRPPIAGGGLANGHKFERTPDWYNTCVSCHTSRGGHAYLGSGPNTEPDVHLTKAGYDCNTCHKGVELHGDSTSMATHRYAYEKLPTCNSAECHPSPQRGSNIYHAAHYDSFNCHVCHSQDYNSCGQCHIHDGGALVPAYMDFKIALNPIPETKTQYDIALVRRTLAWQDNWEHYGETYPDGDPGFDTHPTYNYTTPHNILKRTSRTPEVVDPADCAKSCHIYTEGDSTYNTQLYLKDSDLLEWERAATGHITMNGNLPAGWPTLPEDL